MAMTVWNPFREMEDIFSDMQRGLGRTLPRTAGGETATAVWAPTVDISETAKEYLVKAELPGVTREQIKVTVENGMLTLSGERKFEKEDKDQKHHRIERSYGSFARRFTLPEDVNTDGISADCKDGIVQIRLPKVEVKKRQSIDVKVQ